ncbi:uncharacterized protein LOC6048407 isoform X1 [Culex quinquefasciatus]|uniref:uncharacterized protein LOC6048407 isoform X1 n=2 Tax=Culex quinquefasciatus TaxID=7176 RepID=UPI0018E33A9D|nr:uncharacterized protein LOC6048407 isoform X1 [Culex quinquefasciatus]
MLTDNDMNTAVNDDSTEICVNEELEDDTSNGEYQTKPKKIRTQKYTQVQLQLAYEAVLNGTSDYSASRMFGVPRGTLQYRVKNKLSDLVVKSGPKCYLNKSQELALADSLHALANAGFTVTSRVLKIFAAEYVKANMHQFPEGSPFPAGMPSDTWKSYFLKRHPDLAERMSENWAHYGSISVAPERVPVWFGCVSRYLTKMSLQTVVQNRRQVFTMDEIKLKRAVNIVTCLFGANAHGNLLPPLILYPPTFKLPTQKKQSELKYAVAHQDTELTAGNFLYQWLSRVFQPWLIEENVPRPVILFLDGHRHQMGYLSSQFCHQHQIVPVSLLPSFDHTLRPLNATLYKAIEKQWRNQLQRSAKAKFTSVEALLEPVLDRLAGTAQSTIRDGFHQSKLFPWNPEAHTANGSQHRQTFVARRHTVDEPQPENPVVVRKVRKNAAAAAPAMEKTVDPTLPLLQRLLESRLSEQQLAEFQARRHDAVWAGPIEQTCLFQVRRDLVDQIDGVKTESEECSDAAQDGSYFEPKLIAVKEEEIGEFSLDIVKEEPRVDFEDL